MTEMYDPSNPAHVGPQVTARPGTKRHLNQVRARQVFFAIRASDAAAKADRAKAAYEAAQTATATIQAQIDVAAMLILAISPVAGRA